MSAAKSIAPPPPAPLPPTKKAGTAAAVTTPAASAAATPAVPAVPAVTAAPRASAVTTKPVLPSTPTPPAASSTAAAKQPAAAAKPASTAAAASTATASTATAPATATATASAAKKASPTVPPATTPAVSTTAASPAAAAKPDLNRAPSTPAAAATATAAAATATTAKPAAGMMNPNQRASMMALSTAKPAPVSIANSATAAANASAPTAAAGGKKVSRSDADSSNSVSAALAASKRVTIGIPMSPDSAVPPPPNSPPPLSPAVASPHAGASSPVPQPPTSPAPVTPKTVTIQQPAASPTASSDIPPPPPPVSPIAPPPPPPPVPVALQRADSARKLVGISEEPTIVKPGSGPSAAAATAAATLTAGTSGANAAQPSRMAQARSGLTPLSSATVSPSTSPPVAAGAGGEAPPTPVISTNATSLGSSVGSVDHSRTDRSASSDIPPPPPDFGIEGGAALAASGVALTPDQLFWSKMGLSTSAPAAAGSGNNSGSNSGTASTAVTPPTTNPPSPAPGGHTAINDRKHQRAPSTGTVTAAAAAATPAMIIPAGSKRGSAMFVSSTSLLGGHHKGASSIDRSAGASPDSNDPLETYKTNQAKLLAKLNAAGSLWQIVATSDPWLIYPIQALEGKPMEKLFLRLRIKRNPDANALGRNRYISQIQFVEKEKITRVLDVSDISHVVAETGKEGPCTLLIYRPKKQPIFMTTFCNQDAKDIKQLVEHALQAGFRGFRLGMIVIHEGHVEKAGKRLYEKRYLRLVKNRLLIFRTNKAPLPSGVVSLNGEGGVFEDERDKRQLKILSNDSRFTFRSDTTELRDKWLNAFQIERNYHESVANLFGLPDDTPPPRPPLVYTQDGRTTGVSFLCAAEDDFLFKHRAGATSVWAAVQEESQELHRSDSNEMTEQSNTAAAAAAASKTGKKRASLKVSAPAGGGDAAAGGGDAKDRDASASLAAAATAKEKEKERTGGMTDAFGRSPNTTVRGLKLVPENEKASASTVRNNSLFSQHNLDGMKQDQRIFFGFVFSRLRSLHVLATVTIPTPEEWKTSTAESESLFPAIFGDKRGDPTKRLDRAVEIYYQTCFLFLAILKHSRIVVSEASATSAGQVGFAFPRFDEHVFDLGKYSVVSPWQFFPGTGASTTFTEDTWRGALNSRSSGKEFMQSSPDVVKLYEEGKIDFAKTVMHESARENFHNISLAAHFRANKGFLLGGDIIRWDAVMSGLFETMGTNNRVYLSADTNVGYTYEPSERMMLAFLQQYVDRGVAGTIATAATTAGGATKTVQENSPTSSTSPAAGEEKAGSPPTVSSVPAPSTVPVPAASNKDAKDALSAVASMSVDAAVDYISKNRFLCTPIRWLFLLRHILDIRTRSAVQLQQAVSVWQKQYPERKQKRMKVHLAVDKLENQLTSEMKELKIAGDRLPTLQALSQHLNGEARRSSAAALSGLLAKRPDKIQLLKKNILYDQQPTTPGASGSGTDQKITGRGSAANKKELEGKLAESFNKNHMLMASINAAAAASAPAATADANGARQASNSSHKKSQSMAVSPMLRQNSTPAIGVKKPLPPPPAGRSSVKLSGTALLSTSPPTSGPSSAQASSASSPASDEMSPRLQAAPPRQVPSTQSSPAMSPAASSRSHLRTKTAMVIRKGADNEPDSPPANKSNERNRSRSPTPPPVAQRGDSPPPFATYSPPDVFASGEDPFAPPSANNSSRGIKQPTAIKPASIGASNPLISSIGAPVSHVKLAAELGTPPHGTVSNLMPASPPPSGKLAPRKPPGPPPMEAKVITIASASIPPPPPASIRLSNWSDDEEDLKLGVTAAGAPPSATAASFVPPPSIAPAAPVAKAPLTATFAIGIIKEGWVETQSKTSDKSRRWKQRWFVLKDTTLYSFREERHYLTGGRPTKMIALSDYSSVRKPSIHGDYSARSPHSFDLYGHKVSAAVLPVCAPDETEQNSWMRVLTRAMLSTLGAPKTVLDSSSAVDSYSVLDASTVAAIGQLFGHSLTADESQTLALPLVTKLMELGLVLAKSSAKK